MVTWALKYLASLGPKYAYGIPTWTFRVLSRERGLFSIALSLKKRVGSISHSPAYILISLYDIGFGGSDGKRFFRVSILLLSLHRWG